MARQRKLGLLGLALYDGPLIKAMNTFMRPAVSTYMHPHYEHLLDLSSRALHHTISYVVIVCCVITFFPPMRNKCAGDSVRNRRRRHASRSSGLATIKECRQTRLEAVSTDYD